jgi:hypothetical protein
MPSSSSAPSARGRPPRSATKSPPSSERLADARVVAVLADNGPAWAIADLATLAAGVVHLPLPGFFSAGADAPRPRTDRCRLVLTDQPERIGKLDLGFAITGHWQGLTWLRRIVPAAALPAGTAKISFTSGSTGTPKGVCLSAEGLHRHRPGRHPPAVRPAAATPPSGRACRWRCCWKTWPASTRRCCAAPVTCRRWPPGLAGHGGFDPAVAAPAANAAQPDSLILVPELLKAWTLYLAATAAARAGQPALSSPSAAPASTADCCRPRPRHSGLPGLRPDRMRLGGQPQPARRRRRRMSAGRCRMPKSASADGEVHRPRPRLSRLYRRRPAPAGVFRHRRPRPIRPATAICTWPAGARTC